MARMQVTRLAAMLIILFSANVEGRASAGEVYIPDPALQETIRLELHLSPEQPITDTAMLDLQRVWTEAADLTGLEYARNLNDLMIFDAPSLDLLPLAGLQGLRELRLQAVSLRNTDIMSGLSALQNLNLWIADGLTDLDLQRIGRLTTLRELNLSRTAFSSLAPLAGLSHLTALELSGTQIDDLNDLMYFPGLSNLALSDMGLTDISPLAQMTNLRSLNLSYNQVHDLSPLGALPNLDSLFMVGNGLSDLTGISNRSSLTTLWLMENQISDLTPLSNMTELRRLALGWNHISDVGPLRSLRKLDELWLVHNEIIDIHPLTEARIQSEVRLDENPLGPSAYDLDIPILLANNPGLVVVYDPVPEPTSLALVAPGLAVLSLLTRQAKRIRLAIPAATRLGAFRRIGMTTRTAGASAIAVMLICLGTGKAYAADYEWKDNVTGNWNDATKWHRFGGGTGFPGPGDWAYIRWGTPRTGGSYRCKSVHVYGTGSLTELSGSSLEVESGSTGLSIYGNGSCTLNIGASLKTYEATSVGDATGSACTLRNTGGRHAVLQGTYTKGDLFIGESQNSQGTYILEWTDNNQYAYELDVAGDEYVGYSGTGTFQHSHQAYNRILDPSQRTDRNHLYIGYNAGSSGEYTLADSAQLDVRRNVYVGYNGDGAFTHAGTATNEYDGQLVVGSQTGSVGTYVFSGTGAIDPDGGPDPTSSGISIGATGGTGRFEWKESTARIFLHDKVMTIGAKGTLAMGFSFGVEALLAGDLFQNGSGSLDISEGKLEIIDGATGTVEAGQSAAMGSLGVINGTLGLADANSALRVKTGFALEAASHLDAPAAGATVTVRYSRPDGGPDAVWNVLSTTPANLAGLANLTARFEFGQGDVNKNNATLMEAAGGHYADGNDDLTFDADDFSMENFVIDRLAIGRSVDDTGSPIGATAGHMLLSLTDAVDNSPGAEPEAVYVDTLEMLPGGVFNPPNEPGKPRIYYLHAAGESNPDPNPRRLYPGDANLDGKVDGLDFLRWQSNFNQWPNGGATWTNADFNGDRKVDGLDFLRWQAWFGSYSPGDDLGMDSQQERLAVDTNGDGVISLEEATAAFGDGADD